MQCRHGIVAKLPLLPGTTRPDSARAESEYQVLVGLQSRFAQDHEYGTLFPVAYLGESGLLITRRFDGHDLLRCLRPRTLLDHCRHAGTWLRRLHDACPGSCDEGPLGAADRIDSLQQSYRALFAGHPAVRAAYEKLSDEAAGLETRPFRRTWNHGDFKPENILFDGRKYVGMDMLLRDRAPVLYDLASFLNHLLLAGRTFRYRYVRVLYKQAEQQLLTGYGDMDDSDRRAIRWLQSYFLLHYWGRSQQQGRLRALHGNWQVLPVLRGLDQPS